MTGAFDAFSSSSQGTGTLTWNHDPVGTPRGVIVLVAEHDTATDGVTGVTYGGTSMAEVSGSPNVHGTGEIGVVHCFFLGSMVPTDDPAEIVVSINGTFDRRAGAITLTAASDIEIVDSDATIESDSLENPSVVLSLASRTSFAAIGFYSGLSAFSLITPLSSWTDRLENQFTSGGSFRMAGWYTYDTVDTADVTAGWLQIADDATMIALAVSEVEGGEEDRLIGMAYSMVTDRIG